MKKQTRIAIVRIITDLIKADSVIDLREMEFFTEVKSRYRISKEEEMQAMECTLAEAIDVLADEPMKERLQLMQDFSALTLSDGFCARQEALLMIALMFSLEEETKELTQVISVESPVIRIDDTQIIYVESAFDKSCNEEIHDMHRQISKEMKVAGFNFIYIPFIAKHYQSTPSELFHRVVSFLAPQYNEEHVEEFIGQLSGMTTDEFCKDQLCNKLDLLPLRETNPALLIKIGETFAEDKFYTNFLKIEIDGSVLSTIQSLLDRFSGILSNDSVVIRSSESEAGLFLYYGFYKQLFDIYLLRSKVRSSILINPYKETVSLPDLHTAINGLHRREKALYTLFLIESKQGGINFTAPESGKQIELYNKRMKQIQAKYNLIYALFGGEREKAPMLEQAEIRRPMISCIKRCIGKLENLLHHPDDYKIRKNSFGNFGINIEDKLLFITDAASDAPVPLFESELYRQICKL